MIKEYDVKDKNRFTILGSISLEEEGLKRMFNKDLELLESVNARAGRLALNTSGMQIRFSTNSKKIKIKVKLKDRSNMSNMSSLGQSGVDIYVFHKELKKYVFQKSTPYDSWLLEYQYELINNPEGKYNDYIINLPLYNSVEDVKLIMDKNADIIPYRKNNNDNIVIYGTSIVQGGTVSRSGLLYSNIISRRISNEIFNFGFSGVAFLEKEMAKIISQVKNPKLLIVDAQPNAGVDERLKNNLPGFIEEYRSHHPNTKILVCSRISYAFDYVDKKVINQNEFNRNFMTNYVKELRKTDKNIFYIDGKEVFGDDFYEYTVDGIHPNDLGSMLLAEYYYNKIKKYISEKEG